MTTPLHAAVAKEQVELVSDLISTEINVDEKNQDGDTALYLAVKWNNEEIVKRLINVGANVNAKNNDGNTPLHKAVNVQNENIIMLLIDAGADINIKNEFGYTPVNWAVRSENIDILKLLLKAGADVNPCNEDGKTLLAVYIQCFESEMMTEENLKEDNLRLVLECTDVNIVNENGKNFIIETLESNRVSPAKNFFVKIILEYIAKLKILNLEIQPYLMDVIFGKSDHNSYFTKCVEELEKARSIRLRDSWVRFFNFLIDDEKRFVKFAGNKDLVKDFKMTNLEGKFPIYGPCMLKNLSNGIKSRKLYDTAAIVLSRQLPIFNPTHLIINNILDILDKEDWKKLSESERRHDDDFYI